MGQKVGQQVERIKAIREAFQEGARSPNALRYKSGLSGCTVLRLCREYQIPIPSDFRYTRRRPERDVFVEQGLTLEEIGTGMGITRERVRQYIETTGQYVSWQEKRQEVKQQQKHEKTSLEQFLGQTLPQLLAAYITQRCEEKGFAHQKAWEYFQSRKVIHLNSHSFEELVRFFECYKYAHDREVKLSQKELTESFNWYPSQSGHLLKTVGLESMYWTCQPNLRRKQKLVEVRRAYRQLSSTSAADIAYFLNLTRATVDLRYNKLGGKERKAKVIKGFGFGEDRGALTYRTASQIYEAQDVGFSQEEIQEYVKKPEVVVNYALEHRREIEPKIIKILQVLYPQETVEKPYRQNK